MFEISDVNVPCRASFRSAQQNLTLGTERGCKRVGTRAEIEVEMSNDTKEPAGVSKDICYRHPVGWRFLQITNVEQACEMMFQSLSRSRLQGSLPNSISPQDTRRTSGFLIQRNETAIGAFSNARAVWPNPMDMLKHLANEVIQCPKAGDLMACTAEFCSAGKLAMVLSKAEGASKYFLGGMVAYTKEMKTRLLSVPSDLIQRDTAVSAEVAEAMAPRCSCKSAKPDEIIDEACAEALKLLRLFCFRAIRTDFESCGG